MKNISKYKVDISIFLCIILFSIISIVTIKSAEKLLIDNSHLALKQILWYGVGFVLISFIMFIGNKFLYKNAWIFYFLGVISLILVLIFGSTINDARCWFKIPGIGNIQPSEFMKIILIIILGKVINDFKEKHPNPSVKEEFLFLIKICIIIGIPSILTFLEPDTGVVLIYLLITFIMLLISGIRYRWFILVFGLS